ncbi:MAG: hypothetical protein LIP01_07925 [Tannerellaceae bacterium]|nr:hypothetical protein [Tannerellaceae bacterium]
MSVSTLGSRNKTDVMTGDEFRRMATNRYQNNSGILSLLGKENTDWQKEIYRQAVSTDHHVSVSGGLDFMPYRISMGYTNQSGILKESGFDRFTTTVQLNPTLFNDHLKFTIQAKYMHAKTSFADPQAIKSSVYMDPTQPVYNPDGTYWQWMQDGEVNLYATPNPVSLLEQSDEKGQVNNFMGQIGAEYRFHFAPSLKIVANMGIDQSTGKRTFNSVSPFYGYTGEEGSYYYDEKSEKKNYLFNAYLQWNHTYRRNRLEMMAGYEWQHFDETDKRSGRDIISGTYRYSNIYQTALFGRVHYTHRNKYIVSLEARTGPTYSDIHKWGDNTFGAFTLGWKINEEVFLRNSRTVSNLKLRGSVGTAGQNDMNSYRNFPVPVSQKRTEADNKYYFGDQGYSLLSPSYNPVNYYNSYYYNGYYYQYGINNPIPERTFTVNGGIDFGFWKNRLAGSVDYYYSTTFDLWPKYHKTGNYWDFNRYYNYYGYAPDWERMGFDVSLDVQPILTQNFSWNLGFNFNIAFAEHAYDDWYSNNGTSAPISIGNGEYIQIADESPHTFYLYNWYDSEGDYNYRSYYGKRATPRMIMSLNTTFRYKHFDLSMMFRAHQNTNIYSEVLADQIYNGYMDVWNPNGYFTNRTGEVLRKQSYSNEHYLLNEFVEKGSFVRCDYITLGYTLPAIASIITGGRVYATVQNPFVITRYEGRDPEVGYITDSRTGMRSPGIDTGSMYPRPVSVVLGLTLNF